MAVARRGLCGVMCEAETRGWIGQLVQLHEVLAGPEDRDRKMLVAGISRSRSGNRVSNSVSDKRPRVRWPGAAVFLHLPSSTATMLGAWLPQFSARPPAAQTRARCWTRPRHQRSSVATAHVRLRAPTHCCRGGAGAGVGWETKNVRTCIHRCQFGDRERGWRRDGAGREHLQI